MDSTAIQAISALSAAQLAQNEISAYTEGAVVIPKDYTLQSLEKLRLAPNHFRGQYSTSVLSQFISYIDNHGTSETSVFINQDTMSANAIIDMGYIDDPKWGKHRAEVALKRTPAYGDLLDFNNVTVDQQTFIDFAEDWQDNVLFYYGEPEFAEAEAFKPTIKTLRKLKTSATATTENEVGNFSANRSAMEQIEISAGNQEPPTGFIFKTIPHDGFEEVAFNCQLRAITDGKSVQLKYRIAQLERHKEQIAEQFKDKIVSGVRVDGINIFIGTMSYQN
jgi:uncharacterized protein YfdQ (DUF2303 family)